MYMDKTAAVAGTEFPPGRSIDSIISKSTGSIGCVVNLGYRETGRKSRLAQASMIIPASTPVNNRQVCRL